MCRFVTDTHHIAFCPANTHVCEMQPSLPPLQPPSHCTFERSIVIDGVPHIAVPVVQWQIHVGAYQSMFNEFYALRKENAHLHQELRAATATAATVIRPLSIAEAAVASAPKRQRPPETFTFPEVDMDTYLSGCRNESPVPAPLVSSGKHFEIDVDRTHAIMREARADFAQPTKLCERTECREGKCRLCKKMNNIVIVQRAVRRLYANVQYDIAFRTFDELLQFCSTGSQTVLLHWIGLSASHFNDIEKEHLLKFANLAVHLSMQPFKDTAMFLESVHMPWFWVCPFNSLVYIVSDIVRGIDPEDREEDGVAIDLAEGNVSLNGTLAECQAVFLAFVLNHVADMTEHGSDELTKLLSVQRWWDVSKMIYEFVDNVRFGRPQKRKSCKQPQKKRQAAA